MLTALMVVVIVAVVAFNVTSGFHDAADVTATSVATRAVRPGNAIALVAVFGFIGPLVVGTAVADTIGSVVDLGGQDPADALRMVLAGVAGAMAWNLVTWRFSIPSSSSHALVGGLVGVVAVAAGPDDVEWGVAALLDGELEGVCKIVAALLLSPIAGLVAGYVTMKAARFALRGATPRANRGIRRFQAVSTALLAFAQGANDAQKSMGIIGLVLVLGGSLQEFAVPQWAVVLSAASLTAGAVSGGWSIVRTLGFGIFRLEPLHGADAQLSSAAVVYGASLLGGPVSTTQVVSSAIMGVGTAERPRSVGWDTGKAMVVTWLVTVPASAIAGIAVYAVLEVIARAT